MHRSIAGVSLSGVLAAVTVVGGLSIAPGTAFGATNHGLAARPAVAANVQRLAGATRIETAIATSKDSFPTAGSAQVVVLARSDSFPDALAGGPLAAKLGGPLLLVPAAAIGPVVKAEIQRVAAVGATVYVLGGTAGLSTGVDAELTSLGYVPKRLAGKDRFATAVAIADAMGDPTTVLEATGLAFPDALAGGPAAIETGGVILLTNGTSQAPATAAYLAAHPGGLHYALGGAAAKADPSATPLVGADRYWTAVAIASTFFPTPTTIGAVSGAGFADALAAGPALAAKHAPLLLVSTTGPLSEAATVELLAISATTTSAVVFGGTVSVADAVAAQIGALTGAAATAANTAANFSGQFGVISERLVISGAITNATEVVDASNGDTTVYIQGHGSQVLAAGSPTRAELDALPLQLDNLKAAVNAMFAAANAAAGVTTTDPDDLFTLNASDILLDPVASPALRLATYATLAADDAFTQVASGVKDSTGRTGIEIFLSNNSSTDKSRISYLFDPLTLLPLEHKVIDPAGALLERETFLSVTTTATAPASPYTS
ncbi:MAG: hypothetical protein QOJ62_2446 [Actinomycetota bacterium]|nr:hypothetical protein [Actinomycetota bacterium]